MTTNEIVAYYCNLLIIQYFQKPKAYVTIDTLVRPVIMDQLPISVQDGFDIATAVGAQLDTIAKYAGVVRNGIGLTGTPITLIDSDFRALIRMGIIRNMSDSSLATIQTLLNIYFPDEILIFDYASMRISFFVNSSVGSQDLAQLFITEGLLPKPMGVLQSGLVYGGNLNHFFGFITTKLTPPNIEPFNTVISFQTTWLWFSVQKNIGGY